MFAAVFKQVLNFLYPPACVYCRQIMLDDNLLCHKCWKDFQFITQPYCDICGNPFAFEIQGKMVCGRCIKTPPIFDLARHLFKFDQFSKKLIHSLKYNDQTYLAKIFTKMIVNNYNSYIGEYDLIVPVPMHWLKRMFRMYNQAFLLAKEISTLTNLPLFSDILIKTKWTKAQSSLLRAARQKNLNNSFAIINPHLIKGKKIILIDDVLTTGATVKECCKLLKKFGASKIIVLTIAAT